MSYSTRQRQCLEAMGIVPWVQRSVSGIPALETAQDSQPEQIPGRPPAASLLNSQLLPTQLSKLQVWLPNQYLAPWMSAGKMRHTEGPEESAVLVAILPVSDQRSGISSDKSSSQNPGPGVVEQPLAGESGRLFDLMMRAINLSRQQLRLCVLQAQPGSDTPTFSEVCSAQTKAVLVLVQSWEDFAASNASDLHDGRLDTVHLPFWCIPHPDVLLRQNALKRQAWQALQALQRTL